MTDNKVGPFDKVVILLILSILIFSSSGILYLFQLELDSINISKDITISEAVTEINAINMIVPYVALFDIIMICLFFCILGLLIKEDLCYCCFNIDNMELKVENNTQQETILNINNFTSGSRYT